MQKEEWVKNVVAELEAKVPEMSPADFRFYNISHLPLIAMRTLENTPRCSVCADNVKQIDKMVASLPDVLTQNASERKAFEQKKSQIEKHLRKKHNYHFPGYFAALGSLLGLAIGIIAAALVVIFGEVPVFNKLSILLLGVFLLTGWFLGNYSDQKVFKRKLQL